MPQRIVFRCSRKKAKPGCRTLKRCYSLKRNKEFRHTYRVGKSAGCKSMVLIYAPRKGEEVKIGFSVGKKIGNAVVRNRTKRRLREAVTPFIPGIKQGSKLIFIAKLPILEESLPGISSAMRYLLRKANLLETRAAAEAAVFPVSAQSQGSEAK